MKQRNGCGTERFTGKVIVINLFRLLKPESRKVNPFSCARGSKLRSCIELTAYAVIWTEKPSILWRTKRVDRSWLQIQACCPWDVPAIYSANIATTLSNESLFQKSPKARSFSGNRKRDILYNNWCRFMRWIFTSIYPLSSFFIRRYICIGSVCMYTDMFTYPMIHQSKHWLYPLELGLFPYSIHLV